MLSFSKVCSLRPFQPRGKNFRGDSAGQTSICLLRAALVSAQGMVLLLLVCSMVKLCPQKTQQGMLVRTGCSRTWDSPIPRSGLCSVRSSYSIPQACRSNGHAASDFSASIRNTPSGLRVSTERFLANQQGQRLITQWAKAQRFSPSRILPVRINRHSHKTRRVSGSQNGTPQSLATVRPRFS